MPIPIRTLGDVRDRKRRDSQRRFLVQHSLAPPPLQCLFFFPSSLSPTPFNACYIIVAKFCSQTSLYRIGLHVGELPFFKCDEMRLRWVFISLSKQKSVFWKIFLNSIDFIQVALAEVLGETVLITYFWTFSQCVPRGPARRRFQVRLRAEPFSPLFFFSFPFCLDFFLVIVIYLVSL